MENRVNYSELIDKYFEGLFGENDQERFQQEMDNNPQFAEEFELTSEINDALAEKDVMQMRDLLDEIHEDYVSQEEEELDLNKQLEFFREIDEALAEKDVINLRSKLDVIHEDEKLESQSATDLSEGSDLFREIDKAIREKDVIKLRDQLNDIHEEAYLKKTTQSQEDLEFLNEEVDMALKEKDVIELRDQLEDIHDNEYSTTKTIPIFGNVRGNVRKITSLAASFAAILILGTVFLTQMNNSFNLEKFYQPYDQTLNYRGESQNSQKMYNLGLNFFMQGKYEEAAQVLEGVEATPELEPNTIFFLGQSYMFSENFEKAAACFEKLLASDDNLFWEINSWYLAGCYTQYDEAKAIDVYKMIVDDNNRYSEKAKKILRKMNP